MLNAEKRERLRGILHQTPHNFGKTSSLWTLKLLAETCYEQGLSETQLSAPTVLDAVVRLGVTWKRAKHWVTSPDPRYALKKTAGRLVQLAENHSDIALRFADECWWSREQQPSMHSWSKQRPLRLVEQTVPKTDAEPKALACCGLFLPILARMLVRFVTGRPVSVITQAFLTWVLTYLSTQGKRALFLIWDNASWHKVKCSINGSKTIIGVSNKKAGAA